MSKRWTAGGLALAAVVGSLLAAGACESENNNNAGTSNTGGSGPNGGGGSGASANGGNGNGGNSAGNGGTGGVGGSNGGASPGANCDPPSGTPGDLTLTAVPTGGKDFDQPILLTYARGDSTRLYVVEQKGIIWMIKGGVA